MEHEHIFDESKNRIRDIYLTDHFNPIFITLGKIDFDNYDGSITEGLIDSKNPLDINPIGICRVDIYGDEGPIPHFHITNTSKNFYSCIKIYKNEYFNHGKKYKDVLNSKQCKILDRWLRESNIDAPVINNWLSICMEWNRMNPDYAIRNNHNMPNYTEIK